MVEGDRFVIAVGTAPFRPDYVPFDDKTIIDSDTLIEEPCVPRSLAVIGAGGDRYRICHHFQRAGRSGDIDRASRNLPRLHRSRNHPGICPSARDRGMIFRMGSPVAKVIKSGNGRVLTELEDGRNHPDRDAAFRRRSHGARPILSVWKTADLQPTRGGRLKVNAKTFQTDVPHIYAAGDVIGFPSLASTSMEQGRIAACPCLRSAHAAGATIFPLWHLCRAGDFHRGHERGRGSRQGYRL